MTTEQRGTQGCMIGSQGWASGHPGGGVEDSLGTSEGGVRGAGRGEGDVERRSGKTTLGWTWAAAPSPLDLSGRMKRLLAWDLNFAPSLVVWTGRDCVGPQVACQPQGLRFILGGAGRGCPPGERIRPRVQPGAEERGHGKQVCRRDLGDCAETNRALSPECN